MHSRANLAGVRLIMARLHFVVLAPSRATQVTWRLCRRFLSGTLIKTATILARATLCRLAIGDMAGWRRAPRANAVALFLCFFCPVLYLAGQTPSITGVQPLALRPGGMNVVALSGQNLSGPTELWMSFPGTEFSARLDTERASATKAIYRLNVPKEVPVGVGALRLVTTNGITPLQLFMLDDLATIEESATNKTLAQAQLIPWPIAVDGQADEITLDYFRFDAKQGALVSIEVVAQRLGSRLDPVLRLLDKKGREIAYCDDDPRVGRDSRLRCKIPATSTYIVEVRDINYGGGPAFSYRLRIGDFPLAALPFPPFQQPGTNAVLGILSRHEKTLPQVKAEMPAGAIRISLPVRTRRDGGSSFVSLYAADHPQTLEKEPNNAASTATPIHVPGGVSARFEQQKDVDMFRLTAPKGQKLVFRARNRSIGSPCDLFMSIQDTNGATVAEYDPTSSDEGTITNTFKIAGEYFLVIEELNQNGGPDLAYHVDVRELRAGFALSVDGCDLQGRAGENVTMKVTAERRDYDGPIELAVESPFSLKTESSTIPEKKNEVELKIKLPGDLDPGTHVPLRIKGTAKIGDAEEAVRVSTLPALKKLWPNLRYPPTELDGLIAIGVRFSEGKPVEGKSRKGEKE